MDIANSRMAAMLGVVCLVAAAACGPAVATSSPRPVETTATAEASEDAAPASGSVVIVGRIITLADPPVADAVLIEDGIVRALGTSDEVLALADDAVSIVDIGANVAYPGFIDAHAHWIGDRGYYDTPTAAAAMEAALARGWTSISEQWVNPERLGDLIRLSKSDALPLRVDAYLALNYDRDFLGDWYADREPGDVDDRLRVRGLKVHVDDGRGVEVNWDPAELTAAVARADAAGWQVSAHAMSQPAIDAILDAYEAALGPSGPNPLHHRVEHAIQVTDVELARLAAMDIGTVIHLEGAGDWLLRFVMPDAFDREDPGDAAIPLARWRDFVDAGLHVASSSDAPWTFPDLTLTDDLGRPIDQIAAGMDGRVRTQAETPGWLLDQLLTAEEGLRTVTIDAAWVLGDDDRRGRLTPGLLGDVTVLSGDVGTATADEIRAMSVVATIVGGVPVYCADPAICTVSGAAATP